MSTSYPNVGTIPRGNQNGGADGSVGGGKGNGTGSLRYTVNQLQNEQNATALINSFKDHTDPKYTGPGTWNVIHQRAMAAKVHAKQLEFIEFMKETCTGFPCTVCRDHCTKYIATHPLEEYLDVTIEIGQIKSSVNSTPASKVQGRDKALPRNTPISIGMFIWSWKFHNAVNARINKPIMSWDTAYNLYAGGDSLVCSKSCLETADFPPDGSENTNPPSTMTTPIPTPQPGSNINPQSLSRSNLAPVPTLTPQPGSNINPQSLSRLNLAPVPKSQVLAITNVNVPSTNKGVESTSQSLARSNLAPVPVMGQLGPRPKLPPIPTRAVGSTDLFISSNKILPPLPPMSHRFTSAIPIPSR